MKYLSKRCVRISLLSSLALSLLAVILFVVIIPSCVFALIVAAISPEGGKPFSDFLIGGVIAFGEGADAATVAVTNRDERCAMVNFDPDSGRAAPEVLKAIVRTRDNKAGVYATVVRRGTLAVGQSVLFRPY